ncbi:MAG: rhomboid family intramembrane serine protease, partial [Planctomycetota bacterium]
MSAPRASALLLVLLMTAASVLPEAGLHLGYERGLILEGGQPWRAVTGQLVHGTPRLFIADVLGVALLACLLERRCGGAMRPLGVAFASALGAGLCTLWLRPDIRVLEGASGIASGLLAYLLIDLLVKGSKETRWLVAAVAIVL